MSNGFLLSLALFAYAHEHHSEDLTAEELGAPIDFILWLHIAIQMTVWGLLFPFGMVLGLSRSRWHVPTQAAGFALTAAGYVLGHVHGGRKFYEGAHQVFASILLGPIIAQLSLGIYLKAHIHEKTIRPYAVLLHGCIGKIYPILGWTQMLFGVVAFRGFCRGDILGQCLAHYIMGSGFIAYGVVIAILMTSGEAWLKRTGRSPEWWDSWIIMLWGIVNTFTLHRGLIWSAKDLQHTTLGILWWTGGILGIFLARNNQRNGIPAIILILTGWAMSEHAQALMISTKVHSAFGITLMLAGLARLIEVFLIPAEGLSEHPDDSRSDHTLNDTGSIVPLSGRAATAKAFRHLVPFLLVSAGLLFISATDEELRAAHDKGIDHVTYILLMYSVAFIMYNFIIFLIHLYSTTGRNATPTTQHADNIEMIPTTSESSKWYAPVPSEDVEPSHVIGEDVDD